MIISLIKVICKKYVKFKNYRGRFGKYSKELNIQRMNGYLSAEDFKKSLQKRRLLYETTIETLQNQLPLFEDEKETKRHEKISNSSNCNICISWYNLPSRRKSVIGCRIILDRKDYTSRR